jgi:hypothetical protein
MGNGNIRDWNGIMVITHALTKIEPKLLKSHIIFFLFLFFKQFLFLFLLKCNRGSKGPPRGAPEVERTLVGSVMKRDGQLPRDFIQSFLLIIIFNLGFFFY